MKTLPEKKLGYNFALHFTFYLSIALSEIMSHSKTVKNAKKLSVFGKHDSCCLSNFSQTHIFWNFDHICRTYNQINYTNISFAKVIILIMTAHVLFSMFFPKKTRTLMPLRNWWKLMKIANIDREILHIFWATWEISMKFSGKMWLTIVLKVTKNQGFTPSLVYTFFEKLQSN